MDTIIPHSVPIKFSVALIFMLAAVAFVGGNLLINRLFRPLRSNPEKLSNYECGERPIGSPWIRFNIRYYVIAILFIIFDVEVLFIIPWAVVYRALYKDPTVGILVFYEMFVFLLVLGLGLVYCWVKGHLEWVMQRQRPAKKDAAAS